MKLTSNLSVIEKAIIDGDYLLVRYPLTVVTSLIGEAFYNQSMTPELMRETFERLVSIIESIPQAFKFGKATSPITVDQQNDLMGVIHVILGYVSLLEKIEDRDAELTEINEKNRKLGNLKSDLAESKHNLQIANALKEKFESEVQPLKKQIEDQRHEAESTQHLLDEATAKCGEFEKQYDKLNNRVRKLIRIFNMETDSECPITCLDVVRERLEHASKQEQEHTRLRAELVKQKKDYDELTAAHSSVKNNNNKMLEKRISKLSGYLEQKNEEITQTRIQHEQVLADARIHKKKYATITVESTLDEGASDITFDVMLCKEKTISKPNFYKIETLHNLPFSVQVYCSLGYYVEVQFTCIGTPIYPSLTKLEEIWPQEINQKVQECLLFALKSEAYKSTRNRSIANNILKLETVGLGECIDTNELKPYKTLLLASGCQTLLQLASLPVERFIASVRSNVIDASTTDDELTEAYLAVVRFLNDVQIEAGRRNNLKLTA